MSQGYKIAAGYNVVIGSLVDITSISVNSKAFVDPKVLPLYNPGQVQIRADGSVYLSGYAVETWRFGFMFYDQLAYLRTTYCSGGWSGQVTIYTSLGTASFYRMNAQMIIPVPKTLSSTAWYQKVDVVFSRLVASS